MGYFKLPSGAYKSQTYAILKKAKEIDDAITKSGVTHNETKFFYNLVWRPAIEYTLAQLFLF